MFSPIFPFSNSFLPFMVLREVSTDIVCSLIPLAALGTRSANLFITRSLGPFSVFYPDVAIFLFLLFCIIPSAIRLGASSVRLCMLSTCG